MASITTSNQAYRARVELVFDYNENNKHNREEINKQLVQFVSIKDDYINNVLPIIYVSMSAKDDLYNKIQIFSVGSVFIC